MRVPEQEVIRSTEIGKGGMSKVYKGTFQGQACAIKCISSGFKEAYREIEVMSQLEHPNALRLLAWTNQPLQLVVELAIGDLKSYYKGAIGEDGKFRAKREISTMRSESHGVAEQSKQE